MNTTVVKNVAVIAAKIANDNTINRYFKGHYKFGASSGVKNKVDSVKLNPRPTAPKVINNIIVQFNKKPQVVLSRTHGRTTLTERLEMAVFAKCINPTHVANKFSVSLPTVYLYANKYGHLV
jgi:hypothetical protein